MAKKFSYGPFVAIAGVFAAVMLFTRKATAAAAPAASTTLPPTGTNLMASLAATDSVSAKAAWDNLRATFIATVKATGFRIGGTGYPVFGTNAAGQRVQTGSGYNTFVAIDTATTPALKDWFNSLSASPFSILGNWDKASHAADASQYGTAIELLSPLLSLFQSITV